MKYFLLLSVETPKDGDWSDMCEFKIGEKEAIEREFDVHVQEGEYPLILVGAVHELAKAS